MPKLPLICSGKNLENNMIAVNLAALVKQGSQPLAEACQIEVILLFT
jgi:hypothetical protein